jgi:subtilase family serine protease
MTTTASASREAPTPRRIRAIRAIAASILVGLWFSAAQAENKITIAGNHPLDAELLTSAGNADPKLPLSMQIRFAVRNPAALEELIARQQDTGARDYRKWLRTGEFDRRFGPSRAQLGAVAAWLKREGFTVLSASPAFVEFTGNAAQAEYAFSVRIARFGNGGIYANTSDPSIPAEFAGVIGSVMGLDNMTFQVPATRQPPSRKVPDPSSAARQPDARRESPSGALRTEGGVRPSFDGGPGVGDHFAPTDVQTFYNELPLLGTYDGSGQCIAIVGSSDYPDAALTLFQSTFGVPAFNVTRKVIGVNPGLRGGNLESEALLDLEYSHATAPGASAFLYLAFGDLTNAITKAVSDNLCGAISISFEFCSSARVYFTSTLDTQFKKAAAQGQSVFISSGDNGAKGACGSAGRNVNEASADPNVTSVGGTEFTPVYLNHSDSGSVPEAAWNDYPDSGVSGGGASKLFSKPAYQAASTPADGRRDVPDIAMEAGPLNPGVFLANDDGSGGGVIQCCFGGTSLSAPLWAGFSQVMAQALGGRLGNINSHLYALASVSNNGLRDVTAGNNDIGGVSGFTAGVGYDQVTGWGTVDMDAFEIAFGNLPAPPPGPLKTVPKNPTALRFPARRTGTTSGARIATLVNPRANMTTSIVDSVLMQSGAEFAIDPATTTCVHGLALAAGGTCKVGVKFSPVGAGPRPPDAVIIIDDAQNSPQSIPLLGQGR